MSSVVRRFLAGNPLALVFIPILDLIESPIIAPKTTPASSRHVSRDAEVEMSECACSEREASSRHCAKLPDLSYSGLAAAMVHQRLYASQR